MKQITILTLSCSLLFLAACWNNKEKTSTQDEAACNSCDTTDMRTPAQPPTSALDTGYERSEGGGQDATGTGLGM